MTVVRGSQVLQELDKGLSALRSDLRTLDSSVADSGESMRRLGATKLSLYRKLAEHRLAQLERGDIVSSLDSVSHQVQDVLEERERRHRSLLDDIRAAETRLRELESQRIAKAEEVDAVATELDKQEAAVQERLESDEQYNEQLERAQSMDAIADEAEVKTQDAIDDKKAKGEPYESDKLFMYLWRRGYGTSEYSANPLARMLDGWVARISGYEKARPNYWMLKEIPKRLKAHAAAARAASDAEFEKLEQLEIEAAEAMGVPTTRQELDALEKALAEIDESIADVERQIAEMGSERARFASGDDELMKKALDRLAEEMRSAGIQALWRRASLTPDREDDRIVQDISDVEDRLDEIEDEHRDRQKIYSRHLKKVRELEGVRQQFKRRGYDDMRSIFEDGSAVAGALTQFLGGMLDDDDLWRIIARLHRVRESRARPNFGSGGFPRRRGTWQLPRSRPPMSRPKLPRGGGFRLPSGGGFRRPGGGGGFSTGGGF